MSFSVERFPSGPLATNTYVLSSSGKAVVVDPALGCDKSVLAFIHKKGLSLAAIWITHSHLDHFAGCKKIIEEFPVKIVVHAFDAKNMENPGSDLIDPWMECERVTPSLLLNGGENLQCGESVWSVIHTPGHSPGCVCFYNKDEHTLFSGDTLFRGTYGKCSFPSSDPLLMAESLKNLASLPDETIVYPGHGPKTTILKERPWMAKAVTQSIL